MGKVILNERVIYEANLWDFHNGFNGIYDIPEFNTLEEFAERIISYIKESDYPLIIERREYSYK